MRAAVPRKAARFSSSETRFERRLLRSGCHRGELDDMGRLLNPTKVFISYSRKDEDMLLELEEHLALLKRQGVLHTWHDGQIPAGAEWASEISENLNAADVILLLVSPDFLASDYLGSIEVVRALERHKRGDARVIPVIVRPCDWHNAPFAKFQPLPRGAKPVTAWKRRDEAWRDVSLGVLRALSVTPKDRLVRPAISQTAERKKQDLTKSDLAAWAATVVSAISLIFTALASAIQISADSLREVLGTPESRTRIIVVLVLTVIVLVSVLILAVYVARALTKGRTRGVKHVEEDLREAYRKALLNSALGPIKDDGNER